MYSPLTVATEGGGVAVGGSGVADGMDDVGVPGFKNETQAERPIPKIRINCVKKTRGLKNIVRIIPMKNPSPVLGEGLGETVILVVHATHAARRHGRGTFFCRHIGD